MSLILAEHNLPHPSTNIIDELRRHYETHPYPHYSLLATVPRHETYALNLETLWARFNGERLSGGKILLAGCGSFSPYPTSVANSRALITALDLSTANLKRAKLHALLHGCRNIEYLRGDLLDPSIATGKYHFIDAYGVIHHLPDPAAGLAALGSRLEPGGILRIMVYGRQARREAQAVRTALRMLHIRDMKSLKQLLRRAPADSRLGEFLAASSEAGYDSGLADALLHPQAVTYRIREFMELVDTTRLRPLLFAHRGALLDVEAEVRRMEALEKAREADTNFILYLGLDTKGVAETSDAVTLFLNPALEETVSRWRLRDVVISPRLGRDNPVLNADARAFLRTFIGSRRWTSLSTEEKKRTQPFLDGLFLAAARNS